MVVVGTGLAVSGCRSGLGSRESVWVGILASDPVLCSALVGSVRLVVSKCSGVLERYPGNLKGVGWGSNRNTLELQEFGEGLRMTGRGG